MIFRLTLIALAAVASLAVIAGCGEDESPTGNEAADVDGSFLVEMTAHHESAIEMARLALERAERPQIRDLAAQIVATQGEEVAAMEGMHERIFAMPMGEADHPGLGMAAHEMGMDMDMSALARERPFDRAFIDAMIAHHQGAVRMSRAVLDGGGDSDVAALAERIIAAQSDEIEMMNMWRERWFGAASPAGGVPPADTGESMPSHDAMGH